MRAYGRRHRRWRNRYEQPLVLVTEEPGLFYGLAALARLLYRYRSELAPFATAAGLDLAALWLHATHANRWPWVLGVASFAALLALLRGIPWGVQRVEERIYAAVVLV